MKTSDQINKINDFMVEREMLNSRTKESNQIIKKYIANAIDRKEQINLINIICPGYKKDRTIGIEDFSFSSLSYDVMECPNVISMIDKFSRFISPLEEKYGKDIRIKKTIILADTAILNFHLISQRQDIRSTLDIFYNSIKKYLNKNVINNPAVEDVNFVRMSEMEGSFRKLPIEGYTVSLDMYEMKNINYSIRNNAKQYATSLIQDRTDSEKNQESSFENLEKAEVVKISRLEVLRFLYEYGFAGKEIYRKYLNSIVTFTEPSGNPRGYFYNALLDYGNHLPVIYLP